MKIKTWMVFALISIVFFAIQATHFKYSVSDENTYFYMAKLISEGNLPYRDFFYAHPPMHIMLLAAFYALFGMSIFVLKATAVLPIIATGWIIFQIAREKMGDAEGIIAATIFYFSYDTLRFATFATWVSLAGMFLAIGIYLLLKQKHSLAGIALAFAALSGIFSLIGGLAAGAYLFFTDKKAFIRLCISFTALFAAANILLILISNGAYITDIISYHLLKPSEGGIGKSDIFWHFIKLNPVLIAGLAMFFFSRKKMKPEFVLPASIAGAFIIALLLMNKIFEYYFLIPMPFIAILAAKGIKDFYERINDYRKQQAAFALAAIILISIFVSSYYYLANDFQDFEDAEQISKWIKENSNRDDTIFGDDSITPLIGLLSERKLAFGMADTNSLIWRSGLLDINDTIRKIKAEKVKYVIERRLNQGRGSYIYGPAYIDAFKNFLKNECREAKSFKTTWRGYLKEYYIYECSR